MKGPCPQCGGTLDVLVTKKNVEVDRCKGCGGTWFDPGELAQSAQVDEQALLADTRPRATGAYTCPGCEGEMRVAESTGHQIDVCPSCKGLWVPMTVLAAVSEGRAASGHGEPLPEVANHVKGRPGSTTEDIGTGFILLDMLIETVGLIL